MPAKKKDEEEPEEEESTEEESPLEESDEKEPVEETPPDAEGEGKESEPEDEEMEGEGLLDQMKRLNDEEEGEEPKDTEEESEEEAPKKKEKMKANSSIKPTMHYNNGNFGGNIIYHDDKITVVPTVIMKERVTNGALKQFEEFKDSAHWYENRPIVPPHKQGDPPVTHMTPKVGIITMPRANAENKSIEGFAVFFNDRIKANDLARIKAGEMFGNSPGYYCNDEVLPATKTWEDGTPYKTIERGPYYPDHVSMVPRGACPLPHCGFNVNASLDENLIADALLKVNSVLTQKEFDNMSDEIKGSVENPVTEATTPGIKANAEQEVPKESLAVKTEQPTIDSDVGLRLNAIEKTITDLQSTLVSKDAEISALKDAEAIRVNAAKLAEEEKFYQNIYARLNPAGQMDWDKKHKEAIKTNMGQWLLDNYNLFRSEPLEVAAPVGATFVPHVNAADDETARMIPSIEDISKRVR